MSMQMYGILAMVGGVVALLMIVFQFRKGFPSTEPDEKRPYKVARQGHLMTDGEWHVYERLRKAMPDGNVFAQVDLGHILEVTDDGAEKRKPKWTKKSDASLNWRKKIVGEVVDFVVCDSVGKVLAIVELGDASRSEQEEKISNEDKDKALDAADIWVFRWTMRTLPKTEDIRKKLNKPRPKPGEYAESDADKEEGLPILS